jgi:hypothetical protein
MECAEFNEVQFLKQVSQNDNYAVEMSSSEIWRLITITILDIIHRPVFYLKYDVSETELSPTSGGSYGAQ